MVVLRVGFLVCLVICAVVARVRYDRYEVYNIVPRTKADVNLLHDLQRSTDTSNNQFDFWTDDVELNIPVVVMVPPNQRSEFRDFIGTNALETTWKIKDLQTLINNYSSKVTQTPRPFDWSDYRTLEENYAWLDHLAITNANVEVVVVGITYEGREIRGIKITHGANLPGVIFESGIHAREWIGPASSSWIIDKVLKSKDSSVLRQFNYLYIPHVNPDGYVYSWTDDRLWRKTRKPYKTPSNKTCYGVDPNRNWDIHWMESSSSNDPCSIEFAGSKPFSEIETKSLSEYYKSVSGYYDVYISFHSFSQTIMYPWSYTLALTPLADVWQRIGDEAAAALKAVHGKIFKVACTSKATYPASGTSVDWYYQTFNISLLYTFEGRDTGQYGFILPPNQIIPAAEEILAAIQTILTEYQKL